MVLLYIRRADDGVAVCCAPGLPRGCWDMMPQPILLGKKLCDWVPEACVTLAGSLECDIWFLCWTRLGFEAERLLSRGSSNRFLVACMAPEFSRLVVEWSLLAVMVYMR